MLLPVGRRLRILLARAQPSCDTLMKQVLHDLIPQRTAGDSGANGAGRLGVSPRVCSDPGKPTTANAADHANNTISRLHNDCIGWLYFPFLRHLRSESQQSAP